MSPHMMSISPDMRIRHAIGQANAGTSVRETRPPFSLYLSHSGSPLPLRQRLYDESGTGFNWTADKGVDI